MILLLFFCIIIIIGIGVSIYYYVNYGNTPLKKQIIYGNYMDLSNRSQDITNLPVSVEALSINAIYPGCKRITLNNFDCPNGKFLMNGYIISGTYSSTGINNVISGEIIANESDNSIYKVTLSQYS